MLIDEKTSTHKGFNSQCERFNNRNQTIKYTFPGPGAYNVTKKVIETGPSNSSKYYGNGFISNKERFDDNKEFYEKYLPGPGQHDNKCTIIHDNIDNTLKYQSLHSGKSSSSLRPKATVPGPGFYNPTDSNFTIIKNPSEENHYFKSKKERFDENQPKKVVPGPGRYFKNTDFYTLDTIDKVSFFFKRPPRKKENLIEKYIETNDKPKKLDIPPEILKTETTVATKGVLDTDNSLVEELQNLKTLKTLTSSDSKTDFYEIPSCFDKYKNMKNSPIKVEDNSKKESFNLFKAPGPAYYNPALPLPKISFNSNEKKKLWI